MIPLTHQEFLDEPRENVDWFPQFRLLESEIEEEQIKAASSGR